jgi:cytoskeleton protein RodZ
MSEENAVLDPVAVPEEDRREPILADEAIDVGEHLRLAREARGISIGDAAAALKLSPHQVEALEADDWFRWPRTVTRGFVRNYARYLGLDAGPLMETLDHVPMQQGPELAVGADSSVDLPRERQRDRRDTLRVVAGLIALALALLVCFFISAETWQAALDSIKGLVSDKETVSEPAIEPLGASGKVSGIIETVPEALPFVPVPVPDTASAPGTPLPDAAPVLALAHSAVPSPPVAAASPEPAPAPIAAAAAVDSAAPHPDVPEADAPADPDSLSPTSSASSLSSSSGAILAFSFAQPSWVEVRDRSGQIVLSRTNPAGSQQVAGQPPFTLVIGNASHVSLQYKGQPVELSPRSRDDVARLTLE